MASVDRAALLDSLPAEWPEDLLPAIREQATASGRKVVVLDDDPTGTQTVHGVEVLTAWSQNRLQEALHFDAPAFYVLTNSRSLPGAQAAALNAEIGRNLLAASQASGVDFTVVSRSDSTLRGHYPAEVDALAAACGDSDASTLIIPFFLEGGRYTIHDIHYVAEGDQLVPAAETPFARDAAFGYSHSRLQDWVAEKSGGRIDAAQVASISLDDIRVGGPQRVADRLRGLGISSVCIVNAASYRDLEVFVLGLWQATSTGKRFIYRTAASFVRVLAGIAPQPLLTLDVLGNDAASGVLYVVGSYVPKSTAQLDVLMAQPAILPVEARVAALLDPAQRASEITRVAQATSNALGQGQNTVIYTSRELMSGIDAEASLAIGSQVSDGLVGIVQALTVRPRYLVAKGGITSSDVAVRGLNVAQASVQGQILPGVPVWRLGPESRYPGLAYVVFPGNVGDEDALAQLTG